MLVSRIYLTYNYSGKLCFGTSPFEDEKVNMVMILPTNLLILF